MLLEKEQYLMKSHHFVWKRRSEPSTGNASAQVTENPLVDRAWTFQPGWWDPLVSPKEMFIPSVFRVLSGAWGSWSHHGYSPQVPAVSSMFPDTMSYTNGMILKQLRSAGLIRNKGCLSFTSHKVQNCAAQGEDSCPVTVPEIQALSLFLLCYPLYFLVLLLCIATWSQGAAPASHIMSSLQGFRPEENKKSKENKGGCFSLQQFGFLPRLQGT